MISVSARKLALLLILLSRACSPPGVARAPSGVPASSQAPTVLAALPPTPTLLRTAPPGTTSSTVTPATVPSVSFLDALVTADLLSCRYGPGPDYLYLFALRRDARIRVIGRTEGSNWVWVDGRNKCWVNARYLDTQGDTRDLPVAYPEPARLPQSPYYPPTAILSAVRTGDIVTVRWLEVPLRPGDEEDESMLHYIVEVWHCRDGKLTFEPFATDETSITFLDQPGCAQPSHGRVFIQEKHGFAGPAEIPWP